MVATSSFWSVSDGFSELHFAFSGPADLCLLQGIRKKKYKLLQVFSSAIVPSPRSSLLGTSPVEGLRVFTRRPPPPQNFAELRKKCKFFAFSSKFSQLFFLAHFDNPWGGGGGLRDLYEKWNKWRPTMVLVRVTLFCGWACQKYLVNRNLEQELNLWALWR